MPDDKINDMEVRGEISDAILDGVLNIAHGVFAHDKNFRNVAYTGETFLQMLSRFGRGVKDGSCILSGAVVDPPPGMRGTQRIAVNMKGNYILMVDFDRGDSVDEIVTKIEALKLCAVVWTTHSHMKPTTDVPEAQVIAWLQKEGVSASTPTDEQVFDYMRKKSKIYSKYLTELSVIDRKLIAGGGRVITVEHAPYPRCRALFLLKDKFDFATRAGSQKEVIEEWKERYTGFCEKTLGVEGWDRTCADPSRLMYLPRIADDADITLHRIVVVAGAKLDLETVERIGKTGATKPQVDNAFTRVSPETPGARETYKTARLREFLVKHGHDFEAETWLKDKFGAEQYQCPWSGEHSSVASGVDVGFKAWDASAKADGGFGMHCRHTCSTDPKRALNTNGRDDRARYLDALCDKHGIRDAFDLVAWCPGAQAEEDERQRAKAEAARIKAEKEAEQRAQASEGDRAIFARLEELKAIGALTTDAKRWKALFEKLKAVDGSVHMRRVKLLLTAMAARADDLSDSLDMDLIIAKTKLGKVNLKKVYRAIGTEVAGIIAAATAANDRLQTEANAAEAAAAGFDPDEDGTPEVEIRARPQAARHAVPSKLEEARVIWLDWDWDTVVDATQKRVQFLNKLDPSIFARIEGGLVRVQKMADKTMRAVDIRMAHWAAELSETLRYKELVDEVEVGCQPPAALKEIMMGTRKLEFSPLDRIIQVPVFGRDGTLRTKRGYDADLQCYLDPKEDFIPVPEVITPENLKEARDNLMDAVRDFPFSDTFDGSDQLPVKLEEVDAQGYTLPNLARGRSSRANMIAMILQPFMRNMMGDNPAPAYHIDKSAPGTGAGYLVDVAHIIAEGSRASAQPMSYDNEEFRKSITATLRSGANFIFIDNINRKVDSGELAAALTAGKWRDRIIMSSTVINIPMTALWVFAGNNLSFTHELMRRNVPIRLDAAVPKPAQDRGAKDFKHMPLQDWLISRRLALIWSCHVLITHWVRQGKGMVWGPAKMLSFDHYAGIMSGILSAAGVEGFLENVPGYLESRDEDESALDQLAQKMYDAKAMTHPLSASEILALIFNPVSQQVDLELPISPGRNGDKHQAAIDLGNLMRNQMLGKTFDVRGGVAVEQPTVRDKIATPDKKLAYVGCTYRVKVLKTDSKSKPKWFLQLL